MKLTAKESAAFAKIGAAICTAKEQGKIKKSELVHVQSAGREQGREQGRRHDRQAQVSRQPNASSMPQ